MTNKPSDSSEKDTQLESTSHHSHSSGSGHHSHGHSSSHRHHHSSGHSSHHHSSSHSSHHHHSSSEKTGAEEKSTVESTEAKSTSEEHSEHHHHHHHSHTRVDTEHINSLVGKYQVVPDEDILPERPPKYHHHHHRRRNSPLKKALIATLCVFLTLIFGGVATFATLTVLGRKQVQGDGTGVKKNAFSVTYDEGKTVEYEGKRYTLNTNIVPIVIIGIDRDQFGLTDNAIGTAGQADLIMLAALDLDTGKASAILIPRDTMVDVDQYTTDGQYVGVNRMQICLSFAYGDGKETSSKNVLNSVERVLYGIPVQLYGVLDLNGIPALNDAIGGVTVTSLETFGDTFVEGEPITLYGMQAQNYVRSRNTEIVDSDTPRRARQIQYFQAFLQKAVHATTQDISTIRRLYNEASDYAFTNVSLSKTTYLATSLLTKGFSLDKLVSLSGEVVDAEPYVEYHLDEKAAFETVLDVFYTPETPAE